MRTKFKYRPNSLETLLLNLLFHTPNKAAHAFLIRLLDNVKEGERVEIQAWLGTIVYVCLYDTRIEAAGKAGLLDEYLQRPVSAAASPIGVTVDLHTGDMVWSDRTYRIYGQHEESLLPVIRGNCYVRGLRWKAFLQRLGFVTDSPKFHWYQPVMVRKARPT